MTRPRLRTGLITALGVVLSLGAGELSAQETAGQQLYESKGCYQCHGYVAQGGSAGPRLTPIPLQAFMLIVRKPPNVMPAYSPKVLSDAELESIYKFVASLY